MPPFYSTERANPPYNAGNMEAETRRLIEILQKAVRALEVPEDELERKLGWEPATLSSFFSGATEITLEQVIQICGALQLQPAEFFNLAYPYQPSDRRALSAVYKVLAEFMPPSPSPAKTN